MNNPLAFIFRLLVTLALIICCFPVVAVILIVLWLTGRLGLARSFIYAPLRNRAPEPERAVPHQDGEIIEAEVIDAQTIMEKDPQDAAGDSKNPFS